MRIPPERKDTILYNRENIYLKELWKLKQMEEDLNNILEYENKIKDLKKALTDKLNAPLGNEVKVIRKEGKIKQWFKKFSKNEI
jgi:hypothetical protein